MRSVYINRSVLAQAVKLRRKLWLSLIVLFPIFIIVPLDENPDEFLAYTGLTFWQAFAICMVFAIAGIINARRIWKCPACSGYLGKDILTKFCPHCFAYVRIPKGVNLIYTNDMALTKGAALVPQEEFETMLKNEDNRGKIKRYTIQFIIAISTALIFGSLLAYSGIQTLHARSDFSITSAITTSVLNVGGTFSYCWCAFFLFYFDEYILSKFNNGFSKIMMAIYNMDIIKVGITLLIGLAIMFLTFGIFGFVQSYITWGKLKRLKKIGIEG